MTKILLFRNNRNPNKYIEVHSDGCGHRSLRQWMCWDNGVMNVTGDKSLHRWRKNHYTQLIDDYHLVAQNGEHEDRIKKER